MLPNSKHELSKALLVLMAALITCLIGCKTELSDPGPLEEQTNGPGAGGEGGSKGGGTGNAEGYGIRHFVVEKNGQLNFQLDEKASNDSIQTYRLVTKATQGSVTGSFGEKISGKGMASYIPNLDYEGLDAFEYDIIEANSYLRRIRVNLDVRPCFRLSMGRPLNKSLHLLGVYQSGNKAPGTNKGPIIVKISKSTDPVSLVLMSFHPVHWILTPAEGTAISKVVLQGPFVSESSVEGTAPNTEVVFRNDEYILKWQEMDPRDRVGERLESIRNYFGQNEMTFQGCNDSKEFSIPFTVESLVKACSSSEKVSRYSFDNQSCNSTCTKTGTGPAFSAWDPNNKAGNISLSTNFLTATTSPDSVADGVRTKEGQICGRYYIEMKIDRMNTTQMGDGIGTVSKFANPEIYPFPQPPFTAPLTSLRSNLDFAQGDVIGMALDLDEGKIYYSRNGTWMAGANPSSRTAGASLGLYAYEPVFPAINLSYGMQVTSNFGASAFQYPIPEGFRSANLPAEPRPINQPLPGVITKIYQCPMRTTELSENPNVHIVGTYEAKNGVTIGTRKGTIQVKVAATHMPITMALISYHPVHWKIIPAAGAKIGKIVMMSFFTSDNSFEGVSSFTEVVNVFGAPYFQWERMETDIRDIRLVNDVRLAVGANEASFQGSYKMVEANVPFTGQYSGLLGEEPSYALLQGNQCVLSSKSR